jgi:hypothetical protein
MKDEQKRLTPTPTSARAGVQPPKNLRSCLPVTLTNGEI